MVDEVIRIRHSIALNVWAIRILWIGPPVVTLGEEVVKTSGTADRLRGGDGDRLFFQVLICRLENTSTIEFGDIKVSRLRDQCCTEHQQRHCQKKVGDHDMVWFARLSHHEYFCVSFQVAR